MSLLEKYYMRRHSLHIRVFSKRKLKSNEEDKIDDSMASASRIIVVILCRNRERLLSQVFKRWRENVDVEHDYDEDLRIILLRRIEVHDRRSELEIEVMHKWVLQQYAKDSTGLSSMLHACKKKSFVVDALQQCRLEMYQPGETVIIQGDLPRVEDGQFTILSGSCQFVIFDSDAMPLLKLRSLPDKARHDVSRELLQMGRVIDELHSPCGFGELASQSKVKRPASVRAGVAAPLELIVVPRKNVTNCFSKLRGPPVSEAIDFLRQASMGHKVASSEVLVGASSMTKRVLPMGTIMYYKGQHVDKVFLVVNGEVLLDTDGSLPVKDGPLPFQNPDAEKCYCMSGQSILGDEGLCGVNKTYETTAVVISEFATVFEVSNAGKEFLLRRFELERYSALAYKDRMIQAASLKTLENVILLHSSFNNLRKAISVAHRDRGVKPTNAVVDESEKDKHPDRFYAVSKERAALASQLADYSIMLNKNCLRNAVRVRKAMQKRSLDELRIAAKEGIIAEDFFSGRRNGVGATKSKLAEEVEQKVQRALSAFYERRLLLKDMNQDGNNAGLNIASHSMSMLMSAASNAMAGDGIGATMSCDESSYNGSVASAAGSIENDPTIKIREHIKLLELAKDSYDDRMSAVKRMEESLHLPIASISQSQAPSLTQESSATYAKSSVRDSTTAVVLNPKQFTRIVSRRSQKTLDYYAGMIGTKNFDITHDSLQKNPMKSGVTSSFRLGANNQHPCTMFPESKEALLATLREKWEVDPVRKAGIMTSQGTPRYFKVSDNGKRSDPVHRLEERVSKECVDTENGSAMSFETNSSIADRGADVSLLLKDVDKIALDAFVITTHRKERYSSPTSSRAGTPAGAPDVKSRSTTGDNLPVQGDTFLESYFERMKTPPNQHNNLVDDTLPPSENGDEGTETARPLSGLQRRWGKLRTAVAVSSALDPERSLKQYERAIRMEPKTSKYLEGKRKSAATSKYALAPVKHSAGEETAFGLPSDVMSSAEGWKRDTLNELFQTKHASKRSVPVLSTTGAQSRYWEKQIIETIPNVGNSADRAFSYYEVNSIHQNKESQRYKRRQRKANNIS